MSAKAFVLIETAVGKTQEVVSILNKMGGLKSVDTVTGPYDIIAVVEAEDLNKIGDLITGKIHAIEGISRTVTCLAV
ncbi:MAG: Lrp/AsnC ligand binding domain-containing protein [Dehalococcoidia bacterium]|nr:MAG: Lrp/AsnC ligand binding domain-containing protein [Dehalococcoidia bacterium]